MHAGTRRIAAGTAGAALLLACVAGCGGGSDKTRDKTGASSPATAAGAPAPPGTTHAAPLTQQELWKAVIATPDLSGYSVSYIQGQDAPYRPGIAADRLPAVSPAACTAVYWSTQAAGVHPATARIDANIVPSDRSTDANAVLVSYSDTDAPKVLADLRAALPACAAVRIERHDALAGGVFFTHAEQQSTPRLGDESVTFRLTQNVPGTDGSATITVPMTFTVVRVGATIATFWAMNPVDRTYPAAAPEPVIAAQLAKLARATRQGR